METAPSTWAGIITAAATLMTAVGATVLAFAQARTLRQVRQVHTIVNQQRTDAMNFQRALIRALVDHGIEVPVDQSLPSDPASTPPD